MLGNSKQFIVTILLALLNTVGFAAVDVEYSATMCGDQKYLFGCQPLTSSDGSGDYQKTLGDSTVHLHLLFAAAKNTAYDATIEPGQNYLFGCQVLTADGKADNTLQQSGCGCDSTVTLTLSVKTAPSASDITVEYAASINEGETYLFGCQPLTAAGNYSRTIARVGGGDSIINLTLTVPSKDITVKYEASINEGETYLFGCQPLTAAGDYSRTIARVGGGDSIINLTLTMASKDSKVSYDATITEGQNYIFGCRVLTSAGSYENTLANAAGGDSVVTLNLKVEPVKPVENIKVSYSATINPGDNYLFGCKVLTKAGSYERTIDRVNGGDSIISLTLEYPSVKTAYTATIQEGETYLFGCQALTAGGTYSEKLTRAAGGDSIVNLTLKVTPLAQDIAIGYTATIMPGETYLFGCNTYTTSGVYTNTLPRVGLVGDSIITLTLNVLNTTYGDTTAVVCDSITWYGDKYTVSGDYQHTFVKGNVLGGDSILTLHLTVNHASSSDTTAVACDEFTWHGVKYTNSGDYTLNLTNAAGCDSVVTLHLTINHPSSGDTTAVACDSFEWHGVKYTDSGDYTMNLTNAAGCDSVVTLHLTVNHPSSGDTTAVACDEFTWNGSTYTTSGDYTLNLTNAVGCDSIRTLHLTINNSVVAPETYVECDTFVWHGMTLTEGGTHTYYDTLTTVNGCDSICQLNLTITTPYDSTLSLVHKYGDRLIMINRHEINALPGWHLDSLDNEHPEYVTWYEIDPSGNEKVVGTGYYYTLANGEPLPAGYTYYAVVYIPAADDSVCDARGRTENYTISAQTESPALIPSLARPGEDIRIINLNPDVQTLVTIYSADGLLQGQFTVSGENSYVIKAADTQGFYLVSISEEGMKTTLRYMVK